MTGPAGIRLGTGHWIGPAEKPSGSFHTIRSGSPASPGFFQYVCQPPRILMTRPTRNGRPGWTPTCSDTSATVTFRLAPVEPPRAVPAEPTRAAAITAPTTKGVDLNDGLSSRSPCPGMVHQARTALPHRDRSTRLHGSSTKRLPPHRD